MPCTFSSYYAPFSAGEDIRERTDALDAAGNTTAAIGKGFAIGSAALVSLALFGAYITRAKIDLLESSILDPKVRGLGALGL
jgi:inorganic pyrophosphatase